MNAARYDVTDSAPAVPLLLAVADLVLHHEVRDAAAVETARLCLLDSLGSAVRALANADCARLLGPVVPGATLYGGARVVGTSYELDPLVAAFDMALMMLWEDGEEGYQAGWGRLRAPLAGILALADHRCRAGHRLALHDVCTGMVKAHEIQCALAHEHPLVTLRFAVAAVGVGLLGGSRDQLMAAARLAWQDGVPASRPLAAADVIGRGVRHALFALRGDVPREAGETRLVTLDRPLGTYAMTATDVVIDASSVSVLHHQLGERLAAHFGARQAAVILQLGADPLEFARMPVSDYLARWVSAR